MSVERDFLEQYWNEQYDEECQSSADRDPLDQYVEIDSFISRSNGKGRKPRSPRNVILIEERQTGKHISYDPESRAAHGLDDIAESIYGEMPVITDPYEHFRNEVDKRVRK